MGLVLAVGRGCRRRPRPAAGGGGPSCAAAYTGARHGPRRGLLPRHGAEMRAGVVALPEEEQLAVNTGDLMHLWRLVEEKDGGPSWIHMMERTLPTIRYQAWRRDPLNGPPL